MNDLMRCLCCYFVLGESAYDSYTADTARAVIDADYVVLTVDLQQVIFSPGLRNSSSFYLRKMSNFNLGIHNARDGNATMHLWTELVASRGSNEICSCIWSYITSTLGTTITPRTLIIWMDRCPGNLKLQHHILNECYPR